MKVRREVVAACVLGLALAFTAGCKSDEKKAEGPAASNTGAMAVKADNTKCPGTLAPVNPSVPTVAYKGKNIGFCCGKCPAAFAKMTDAEKDAAVAKAMAAK